jgi:hypothetical protein
MWVDALAVEQIKSRSARLGVMKSPSVEAIGELIRGRRCAPRSGRFGDLEWIADPLTEPSHCVVFVFHRTPEFRFRRWRRWRPSLESRPTSESPETGGGRRVGNSAVTVLDPRPALRAPEWEGGRRVGSIRYGLEPAVGRSPRAGSPRVSRGD